ncbi:zinc ribbon domain-containing protein [Actinoplanes sp. NPDC026670]|uniref:zinc ribbon domain-containing protein n=1 Tax=Actinoplanes sp. NPDC026670 TaxID=3154700 RepID=UPI0033FE7FEC
MTAETQITRTCNYCKEQVKTGAIKCKHCGSQLEPDKPSHDGTCPYCKEAIDPSAIKCKHCKTMLQTRSESGNGCQCGGACGGIQGSTAEVRLLNLGGLGGGAIGGSGGGIFALPDHACWADCIDAYADCRTTGSRSPSDCRAALARCQGRCPAQRGSI